MADPSFNVLTTAILLTAVVLIVYPLYFIVIASISDPNLIQQGKVWFLPKGTTLEGYRTLFANDALVRGFGNSLLYTGVGTLISVVITLTSGYALSRKDLVGRKGLMRYFIFTMYFSGGLIPLFIQINKMGLYNTRWVLIPLWIDPGAIVGAAPKNTVRASRLVRAR